VCVWIITPETHSWARTQKITVVVVCLRWRFAYRLCFSALAVCLPRVVFFLKLAVCLPLVMLSMLVPALVSCSLVLAVLSTAYVSFCVGGLSTACDAFCFVLRWRFVYRLCVVLRWRSVYRLCVVLRKHVYRLCSLVPYRFCRLCVCCRFWIEQNTFRCAICCLAMAPKLSKLRAPLRKPAMSDAKAAPASRKFGALRASAAAPAKVAGAQVASGPPQAAPPAQADAVTPNVEASAANSGDTAAPALAPEPAPAAASKCELCAVELDPLGKGIRLVKKSTMSFWCARCNSVCAIQQRWLGTWPIEEFKDLDDNTVEEFYKKAHGGNLHKLKAMTTDMLKAIFTQRYSETDFTEWLPINVWTSRGFTKEQVEACPSKKHEKWGDVYAVNVEQISKSKITDTVKERLRDIQRNSKKVLKRRGPHSGGIDQLMASSAGASGEGNVPSAEPVDGSSDTSDDEDGGAAKATAAKKKKKTQAAEAAAEERAQKAAEAKKLRQDQAVALKAQKEKEKECKAVRALATKIVAKLGPLIPQMERVQQNPRFADLPRWATSRFHDANVNVVGYKNEATVSMKSSSPVRLTCTAEMVTALAAECATVIKILDPMLVAADKAVA